MGEPKIGRREVVKSGHFFPVEFPTLAAVLQGRPQHLAGSQPSPPAFLFRFKCPLSSGSFRPRGGTEPALPNSFSFLSQGTALDLVAFLHPAHVFVIVPLLNSPQIIMIWGCHLFPAGPAARNGCTCWLLRNTQKCWLVPEGLTSDLSFNSTMFSTSVVPKLGGPSWSHGEALKI